ncbi:GNAT family N-acetyltransferase [Shewanella cyperi]|uniref:GNAT family N-acetyltransferase n=1 Tax=Shewanella cyperi TaxID=2814292 RepID=A0A974XJY4_9GAMM|nr:GNAT family N-acetyltransferase [Shewanella cyperi]QSX29781.1 GNAT family N-acetyltransferase [Shewanella cyperi]
MNPMQEVFIRVATSEDAAAIALLSSELGYPASAEAIQERLARLLNNSSHKIYVATQGDNILGWIACERRLLLESGEVFEIVGLVVSKAARRKNVGRQLVTAAERWAEALSARALRVRSNVQRQESHPFYQALGFEKSKTQHTYVKSLLS